jgi:LysR family transcriptional regulator for metE and metH
MLEISHLKLIKALFDNDSVSLAAESLFISQSALSHQIKKLEQIIDEPIFIRHSDPVKLTLKGQTLLRLAENILPQILIAERELLQEEGGRLNIAIECHACFEWLIPTLDAYRISQPLVDFDLSMAFSFEPMQALKNYDVDMVVTSDPVEDSQFSYFPLFEYQMLMAMSKENDLASKKYLQPKHLITQTLLTYPVKHSRLDVFNYFLTPEKIMPKNIRKVELPIMLIQLVLNNQGIATIPEWSLTAKQKQEIMLKKLGEKGIWRTLFLAIRSSDKDLAYMQDFYNIAKQTSFKHLQNIR